jgi:selenocysteine lyase/cysteine desulfurase
VPILRWGNPPRRVLRISAQLYNAEDEFSRLASALRSRLSAR